MSLGHSTHLLLDLEVSRNVPMPHFSEKLNIYYLAYDVASGSEITPCNKIDKALVVNRFWGNGMTSKTRSLHKDKIITFLRAEMIFQSNHNVI